MKTTVLIIASLAITHALPTSSKNKDDDSVLENNKKDTEVRELQNLKESLHSGSSKTSDPVPSSMSLLVSEHKHITTDQDGRKHVDTHERTISNGEVVKDVKAALDDKTAPHSHLQVHVDIPEKNIHETFDDNDGQVTVKHQKRSRPNIRYTPREFASYILKTGDDESVSQIIKEMVENRLMTTDEALSYLQEIRDALKYMHTEENFKLEQNNDYNSDFPFSKNFNRPPPPALHFPEMLPQPEAVENDYGSQMGVPEFEDYESSTELSVEDVIYQISKVLFKHAYDEDGEGGTEIALKEIMQQLHREERVGAIQSDVLKKVMDVIIGSLMDTLGESEGLMETEGTNSNYFNKMNMVDTSLYKKSLSANKDSTKLNLKNKDKKN